MVKCFYDLHIHSGLSPCASNDMSPNNIINMAILKGLDIIAVTDHNSGKNVRACLNVAMSTPLIIIPGMEVESSEGIHMLCYFRTIEDLESFSEIINSYLPDIKNNEKLWGEQVLYDEEDSIIGKEEKMLLNSTLININQLVSLVKRYKGLIFASHVDCYANSIITVLGFIPPDLPINGVEISHNGKINKTLKYQVIQNSDAHFLGDICEKMNEIILTNKSLNAFFNYFGDSS